MCRLGARDVFREGGVGEHRGVAMAISPEWIRAVLTLIPISVGTYWCVWLSGYRWREAIWRAHGAQLSELARQHELVVTPTRTGWRVGDQWWVSGGLLGLRSRGPGATRWQQGVHLELDG